MGIATGAAIRQRAEEAPTEAAITSFGPEGVIAAWTRDELDRRTNRLARAYREMGVGFGNLVTIALPNTVAFVEAALAAWKLGATPQPVSHRLPPPERREIIELAHPALVVGGGPPPGNFMYVGEGFEPDARFDDSPLPDQIAPHRLAVTSGGSTGRPKLILATRRGETADVDFVQMGTDGVVLIPGPLYHNGPLSNALDALCTGNHLIISPRFDATVTLAAIEEFQANWAFLVPTMMLRIWRLPDEVKRRYDLSSLHTIWHMGAPCPDWLKECWINWVGGDRIFEMYTATEALAGTSIRGDEWLERRGSVGRVVFGEMKIVDPESGEDTAPGVIGEIYLRPPEGAPPTYAYVGAQAKALPGGWESLGDMGSFDGDGYLYLADRMVDMILTGGANVYPAEVEAAILAHPGVASCAVVGLPDEDLGNRVHAIVQPVAGGIADVAELRSFLEGQIVRYKVPRSFELVDTPLRDDAGKVRRAALRAERMRSG
jgi:bile acid-coenzyme A ligase